MSYVLFLLFFLISAYWVCNNKFIQNSKLPKQTILILYSIKILVGISTWLVSKFFFNLNSDSVALNEISIIETQDLLHNTSFFFKDFYVSKFGDYGNVFGADNSFWKDVGENLVVKVLAFLNVYSQGNYIINVSILNLCSFFGFIALYKIFIDIYPTKKNEVLVGCFLLPSTLYFSSGISKDILLSVSIYTFFYCLYFGCKNKFTITKITVLILSFVLIFLIRNYIAAVILPFAFLYFLHKKIKIQQALLIKGSLLFSVIGIILNYFFKFFNPFKILADKQASFYALGTANTDFTKKILEPNLESIIQFLPTALRRSFAAPLPFEFESIVANFVSIETTCYILLTFFALFQLKKQANLFNSFNVFMVSNSFFAFIIIGFVVTNAGSIIRYRSLFLPFFIIPVLCSINWDKLFFQNKKVS
jgi:hypothetical protein